MIKNMIMGCACKHKPSPIKVSPAKIKSVDKKGKVTIIKDRK